MWDFETSKPAPVTHLLILLILPNTSTTVTKHSNGQAYGDHSHSKGHRIQMVSEGTHGLPHCCLDTTPPHYVFSSHFRICSLCSTAQPNLTYPSRSYKCHTLCDNLLDPKSCTGIHSFLPSKTFPPEERGEATEPQHINFIHLRKPKHARFTRPKRGYTSSNKCGGSRLSRTTPAARKEILGFVELPENPAEISRAATLVRFWYRDELLTNAAAFESFMVLQITPHQYSCK